MKKIVLNGKLVNQNENALHLNKGEQAEKIVTEYFNLEYSRDNKNHLSSSDIEINDKKISVKSYGASLDNSKNHKDLIKSVEEFISNDYSNTYMYVANTKLENQVFVYEMNKVEFKSFLLNFAKIESDGKFRIRKASDNKINNWYALI